MQKCIRCSTRSPKRDVHTDKCLHLLIIKISNKQPNFTSEETRKRINPELAERKYKDWSINKMDTRKTIKMINKTEFLKTNKIDKPLAKNRTKEITQ